MRDKNLKSSKIQNSPPDICTDSSSSGSTSLNVSLNVESEMFSTQDEELLEILEELQKPIKGIIGENGRLEDIFAQIQSSALVPGFFLILKLNYLRKVWILRLFSERLMILIRGKI